MMAFTVEDGIVYNVTSVSRIFYDMQYHTDLTYDSSSNTVTATVSDYTGALQTSWSQDIVFDVNGTTQTVTPTNGKASVSIDASVAGQITVSTQCSGVRNGSITFVPNTLATAQANQIAQLEAGRQSTLTGGFTAKTLVGSATAPHTYPSNADAQSNFSAAVNAFITNPNKTTVTLETLDAGWISHTKTEFYGVYSDGDAFKEAQYAQYNALEAQVKAQTSVPTTPVTWTPASY